MAGSARSGKTIQNNRIFIGGNLNNTLYKARRFWRCEIFIKPKIIQFDFGFLIVTRII